MSVEFTAGMLSGLQYHQLNQTETKSENCNRKLPDELLNEYGQPKNRSVSSLLLHTEKNNIL